MWTAIADDPLVFMTNTKFLQEHNLQPPASWDDLLNPAYKGMLQMADARTSGTAVTRIFSILQVNNRNEDAGLRLHEEAAPEHSGLHQERRRRHGAGRPRPGRRRHLLHRRCAVHPAAGLRRADLFPKEGIGSAAECIAPDQGRQERRTRQEADRLGDQPDMQSLLAPTEDQLPPRPSEGGAGSGSRRGAEAAPRSSRSTTAGPATTASASSSAGWPKC